MAATSEKTQKTARAETRKAPKIPRARPRKMKTPDKAKG
jgi:hypothetical protein